MCLLCLLLTGSATTARAVSVTKQHEQTAWNMRDVQFINDQQGWAVGLPHWNQATKQYEATIVHTMDGGQTWVNQAAGVAETLRGVCFVDASNGWAVGTNGTILHTLDGGSTWTQQAVATTDELRGVVFVTPLLGWATGIQETHWSPWSGADGWAGSIWHTSDGGQTWVQQSLPANAGILNRIDFVDTQRGWAVGIKEIGTDPFGSPEYVGVVYQTVDGGQTWTEAYSPSLDIVFTGVDFIDAQRGWVVGFKGSSSVSGGTIFATTDGGVTWVQQSPDYTLWDVHFLDANQGYAVGAMYGAAWGPPVLRTQDGGQTWETLHMEMHDGEGFYGVAVTQNRVVLLGDGFVHAGVEACDDGNQVDDDGCTNQCALSTCGDGIQQTGEACDDGNADNTDACLDTCVPASCGDGFVQAGVEACDDGNQVDDDGCTNQCTLPICGNGTVDPGEACDDGNADNTDACLDSCILASCGDGFIHAGVEQCDDGNTADGDGCSAGCTTEGDSSGPKAGCGCASGPADNPAGPVLLWLLLLLLLLYQRRCGAVIDSTANTQSEETTSA